MKTLYLDCFSGISGDMTVAALLDLGIPPSYLEAELKKLGISREYHLHTGRGKQQQITGLRFEVLCHSHSSANQQHHSHGPSATATKGQHHAHGRTHADIQKLIRKSRLSDAVKQRSLAVFQRLAEAEGKIHGIPAARVHFHEVGAIDSIVDIVGVCILLERLAPDQILASPPCEGQGFVNCAHGRFPVPVPATLALLKDIPFRQINIPGELITPTGAAILAEFVSAFVPLPLFQLKKVGHGLGSKVFPNHPNLLRVWWGQAEPVQSTPTSSGEKIDVIETNLDDVTAEVMAHAIEVLLDHGARDAFATPVQMKKGRSGTLLTVLSNPDQTDRLARLLIRETGTLGVRIHPTRRICLERKIQGVKTAHGLVKIKTGTLDGRMVSAKPEWESVRKLAAKRNLPARLVWTVAMAECGKLLKSGFEN